MNKLEQFLLEHTNNRSELRVLNKIKEFAQTSYHLYVIPIIYDILVDGQKMHGIFAFKKSNRGVLFVVCPKTYEIQRLFLTKDSYNALVSFYEYSRFTYDASIRVDGETLLTAVEIAGKVLRKAADISTRVINTVLYDEGYLVDTDIDESYDIDPIIDPLNKERRHIYNQMYNNCKKGISTSPDEYEEIKKKINGHKLKVSNGKSKMVSVVPDREVLRIYNTYQERAKNSKIPQSEALKTAINSYLPTIIKSQDVDLMFRYATKLGLPKSNTLPILLALSCVFATGARLEVKKHYLSNALTK